MSLPVVERISLLGRLPVFRYDYYSGLLSRHLQIEPVLDLDGVTGLTVPPGDANALAAALDRLLSDDEWRTHLGSQAQERACREFTVPRMVSGMMAVYAEAAAIHGAAAATRGQAASVRTDRAGGP